MNAATLHPVAPTIPPDQVKNEFLKIAIEDNADPLWHFELAVPKSTRRAPAQKSVPQPGGEMISLALFNRPDPPCDIEVFGQQLSYEIDPADWLDAWVESQRFTVLSRKRIGTLGGAVGDLVVQWGQAPAQWMGRCFACKAGQRLILIWFRAAEADYARLADSLFVTLSHFRMLDDSPGPLAEKVKWVTGSVPAPWRAAIPVSWQIQQEPASANVASFQATLIGNDSGPPSMRGKLSMALLRNELARDPQDVLEKMLGAVRDAGGIVESGPLSPEQSCIPGVQGWHTELSAKVNSHPAEVRCRILRYPQEWVAAEMLSPPRAAAPEIWMRNKRLLDVATGTLELASPT